MRLVESGEQSENDFEMEQVFRLTVLEALYTQRRLDPASPGIFWGEFERLTGRPREHLEFTIWYLLQKKFVARDDQSRLHLTVEGAEFLEQSYRSNLQQKDLRLRVRVRSTGCAERSICSPASTPPALIGRHSRLENGSQIRQDLKTPKLEKALIVFTVIHSHSNSSHAVSF